MLKLKNIKKDYVIAKEIVPALTDINVEFRNSEFVSILGPSGCGKTTLLNIIGGLDKYSEGDLIINGVSTKDYKDKDWDAYRNYSIGFVFQNYNLISHLTVLGNVELALTLSGISKAERRKRAIKALRQVGLKDKLNKKPNQLSGGQMQRVAIARAIVNDPDIILADEPTGALDTKTSVQIMEILKEISKDKLIIMVTHNPELAEQYSTRIVKLLDGTIIDDSNPYTHENEKEENVNKAKKHRTSMSFKTALSLSLKNLFTKKTRTILTSIAGSIGIIGVALVLSLSNGFRAYVAKMQADTLSGYPLLIEEETVNINSVISSITNKVDLEKFPSLKEVYVQEVTNQYEDMIIQNNITDEYIENVIEKINPELLNGVSYVRNMNRYFYTSQVYNENTIYFKMSNSSMQEMINNPEFISSQYDVLEGKLPTQKDEVVIVVDKYNRLTDSFLMNLGIYMPGDETTKYTFDELMNLEFKVLTNDELYKFNGHDYDGVTKGYLGKTTISEEIYESGLTLKVVGIIRVNENTAMSSLSSGIAYTTALTDYMIERNSESGIVSYLKENVNIDPFSGYEYTSDLTGSSKEQKYNNALIDYGAISTPIGVKIYPVDFDSKVAIKEYLDNYNVGKDKSEQIVYLDAMDILVTTVNTMIDTISYILIAFTAISLVVSSIMIAIITYVSVIERTKEIGILRSIGARKKDISRVFNAETFIIGLTAGLIGVIITVLLNFPINMLISSLVEGIGNISTLSLFHSIILIAISIGLTLLSGFIPAIMAARKNPVEALRSE